MAKVPVRRGKNKDKLPRSRKTLVLRDDLIRRLEAAAVDEGLDASDIVEVLIEERLSGYAVRVVGKRLGIRKGGGAGSGGGDPEASDAA